MRWVRTEVLQTTGDWFDSNIEYQRGEMPLEAYQSSKLAAVGSTPIIPTNYAFAVGYGLASTKRDE